MIGFSVKAHLAAAKIKEKARRAIPKNLGHAAAMLRLTAKRLIRSGKGPSAPGQPPRTQTKRLPRSILYHVTRPDGPAVIGPAWSKIGPAGAEHEHGKKMRPGPTPRARPFMEPALQKVGPRLSKFWADTIK